MNEGHFHIVHPKVLVSGDTLTKITNYIRQINLFEVRRILLDNIKHMEVKNDTNIIRHSVNYIVPWEH